MYSMLTKAQVFQNIGTYKNNNRPAYCIYLKVPITNDHFWDVYNMKYVTLTYYIKHEMMLYYNQNIFSWAVSLPKQFTNDIWNQMKWCIQYGPTQVKCQLLISSFFYVMNFRHFLKMLEFNLWYFWKMSEIYYIKNAKIKSQHLTWGGPYWDNGIQKYKKSRYCEFQVH